MGHYSRSAVMVAVVIATTCFAGILASDRRVVMNRRVSFGFGGDEPPHIISDGIGTGKNEAEPKVETGASDGNHPPNKGRVSFGFGGDEPPHIISDGVGTGRGETKKPERKSRRPTISFADDKDEAEPKVETGASDGNHPPNKGRVSFGFGGDEPPHIISDGVGTGRGETKKPERKSRRPTISFADDKDEAEPKVETGASDGKYEPITPLIPGVNEFPLSSLLLDTINYHLVRGDYPGQLKALYGDNDSLEAQFERSGVKFIEEATPTSKEGRILRNRLNAAANLLTDQEVYESGVLGSILGDRKIVIDIVTVSCYDGQGDLAWAASAKKSLDAMLASRYSGGFEVRVVVFSGSQFGAGMPSPLLRRTCSEYPDVSTLDESIKMLNKNIKRAMPPSTTVPYKLKFNEDDFDMLQVFSFDEESGRMVDITKFSLSHHDLEVLEESLNKVRYDVDEEGYILFDSDAEMMFPEFRDPKEANACLKTTANWGAAKVAEFFESKAGIYDEFTYMEQQLHGMDKADVMVFNFLDMTTDGDNRKHELVNKLFSRIGLSTENTITLLVGESGYGRKYIEGSSKMSSQGAVVKSGAIAVGGFEEYAMGIQLSEPSSGDLTAIGNRILGPYLSEMHSYYFAYSKTHSARKQILELIVDVEEDARRASSPVSKAVYYPAARGGSSAGERECLDMMGAISMSLDHMRPEGLTVSCKNFDGKRMTDCGCWTSAEGEDCLPVESGLNLDVVCSVGLPGPEFNIAMDKSLPLVATTGEGSVASAISYGKIIIYDLRSHKVAFWESYASMLAFVNEHLVSVLSRVNKEKMIEGIRGAVVGEDTCKSYGSGLPSCLGGFAELYRTEKNALVHTVNKLKEYLPLRLNQNKRLAARIETLILQRMWKPVFSKELPVVVGDDIYDFVSSNCGTSDSLTISLVQLRRALHGLTTSDVADPKLYEALMQGRDDWLEISVRNSIIDSSSDSASSDDLSADDIWPGEPRTPSESDWNDVVLRVDDIPDGMSVPYRLLHTSTQDPNGETIIGPRHSEFGNDMKPHLKGSLRRERPSVSWGDDSNGEVDGSRKVSLREPTIKSSLRRHGGRKKTSVSFGGFDEGV